MENLDRGILSWMIFQGDGRPIIQIRQLLPQTQAVLQGRPHLAVELQSDSPPRPIPDPKAVLTFPPTPKHPLHPIPPLSTLHGQSVNSSHTQQHGYGSTPVNSAEHTKTQQRNKLLNVLNVVRKYLGNM